MYHDFVEEYYNESDEEILDEAIGQFKDDQKRRNEELQKFLEDFVNSEEYEQYLEHKRNIIKVDTAIQYSLADLELVDLAGRNEETGEVVEDKYPLTTQSRKMFAFIKQFDRYINNKRNKDILKKQQKGIETIREKIAEVKKIYYCSRDDIAEREEMRHKKKLEEFCTYFNIDLSNLNLNVRDKIKDKVLCYRKIIHSRHLKIKQNYIEIVRKLTAEYKRQREIDQMLNKAYTYKVRRREKIMNDMEVVGEKIILKPMYEYEEYIEEEYVEEEHVPVLEIEKKKPKKAKKGKDKGKKGKGKGKKGKDKKKGSKKSKSTKSKKSKGSKGKKKVPYLVKKLI